MRNSKNNIYSFLAHLPTVWIIINIKLIVSYSPEHNEARTRTWLLWLHTSKPTLQNVAYLLCLNEHFSKLLILPSCLASIDEVYALFSNKARCGLTIVRRIFSCFMNEPSADWTAAQQLISSRVGWWLVAVPYICQVICTLSMALLW